MMIMTCTIFKMVLVVDRIMVHQALEFQEWVEVEACVQGLIRMVHLVDQLSQDEVEEEGVVVEVALDVVAVAVEGEVVCLLVDLEIPIMITCSHPTVTTLVKQTFEYVV